MGKKWFNVTLTLKFNGDILKSEPMLVFAMNESAAICLAFKRESGCTGIAKVERV